jgi:hypothetical protein
VGAPLSPDPARHRSSLRGELPLRAERAVPADDAQRVALGLAMIDTMIAAHPGVPPEATGFDLRTGKPRTGRMSIWLAPYLRNASEGRRTVLAHAIVAAEKAPSAGAVRRRPGEDLLE